MERKLFLGSVPMRPAYKPDFKSPRLSQGAWVDVNPDFNIDVKPEIKIDKPTINTPINIDLGGLPLSAGLFAGSALSFYMKGQVPEGWPQTLALLAGAGLAVAGVTNLMIPKAKASEAPKAASEQAPGVPAALPGRPPRAPVGAPVTNVPYSAPDSMAFNAVTGRIIQPGEYSTVDIPFWGGSYNVRIQLLNSSFVPVTFELELEAAEEPHPTGAPVTSSASQQVSIPAGLTEVVTISMPIASWDSLVDYSDIILTARKRRGPGEGAEILDMRSFVIE